MPLYEYKCLDCDSTFEILISYSKSDDMACQNCGSTHTRKLISTFATIGGSSRGATQSTSSCGSGSSPFT